MQIVVAHPRGSCAGVERAVERALQEFGAPVCVRHEIVHNRHVMDEDASAVQRAWFEGQAVVGLTSGASVPEVLVDDVIAQLRTWWPDAQVQSFGEPERVVFNLPPALQRSGRPVAGAGSTLVPGSLPGSVPDPLPDPLPGSLPVAVPVRAAARPGMAGGSK